MTPAVRGDGLRSLASSLRDGAGARVGSLVESARSSSERLRRRADDATDAPAGKEGGAGPPRLPPPVPVHPLPVLEQPPRIVLSSRGDPRGVLSSDRRGGVRVVDRRGEREQFLLIPAEGDGGEAEGEAEGDGGALFCLKSYSTGRFLSAGDCGAVTAVDLAGPEREDVDGRDGGAEPGGDRPPEKTGAGDVMSGLSRRWDGLTSSLSGGARRRSAGSAAPAPSASETWRLIPRPGGGHALESAGRPKKFLACVPSGDAASRFSYTVGLASDGDGGDCAWSVRFVSGELCFLSSPDEGGGDATSSPGKGRRVRCDLLGRLTLTPDRRGWEVFRLVESGGGRVRIVSWMHPFCVACDGEGAVRSVGADGTDGDGPEPDVCAEWTVERASGGRTGVVIRSAGRGRRVLRRDGGGLSTEDWPGSDGCVWTLDAAHSQTYTLTSAGDGRTVGPFPYVTSNVGQSDAIVLQRVDRGGTVRMYHRGKGRYLRATAGGDVTLDPAPGDGEVVASASDGGGGDDGGGSAGGDAELWTMHPSGGGYTFRSRLGGGYLSHTNDGAAGDTSRLVTSPSADGTAGGTIWQVGPVLPRAVSSSKIKTFAIGTSVAVGTTVAMPFLMAGMLAVVPAEATLAASVLAAGLTGAEAVASVGAIGVTAAIVFREDDDTLGMESGKGGGDGEEDGRGDYTKRPFCDWRSW